MPGCLPGEMPPFLLRRCRPCFSLDGAPAFAAGSRPKLRLQKVTNPTGREGESRSQFGATGYTRAMSSADEPNAHAASDAPVRRRDLAVARSLDSARVRSEGRVQRFLDAGFE